MSRSKKFKKYYSTKYIFIYYIFSVAACMLYLLDKDDNVKGISNSELILKSLLYGIIVCAAFTLFIRIVISLYKSATRKKKVRSSNEF